MAQYAQIGYLCHCIGRGRHYGWTKANNRIKQYIIYNYGNEKQDC